jgi:predicted nucleic acid-binding protein
MVRRRGGPAAGRSFLEDLSQGRFQMENLDREELTLALETHNRYADLNLGLTDLSVVVLAHRHRTTRLLTFDLRDFRTVTPLQGGAFQLLPADGE